MKTVKIHSAILVALSLITLMQVSCTEESDIDSNKSGNFEIYLTKDPIAYNGLIDYSQIDLDTIDLEELPFLTTGDIKSYNAENYIINLKKSRNDLAFPEPGVFGKMFVVLVDDNPEYCGFFWSVMSSVPCNWIYIEDPNELNGLTEKQIQINAGYPDSSHFHGNDPRNSPVILNSFSESGKLASNSK